MPTNERAMLTTYQRRLTLRYRREHASGASAANTQTPPTSWSGSPTTRTCWVSPPRSRRCPCPSASRRSRIGERLAKVIDDALARRRTPSRDALACRLDQLADAVRLNALDVAILEVLLLYETEPVVESLLDAAMSGRRYRHLRALNLRSGCLPCVLGESDVAVHRRFAPDAPLVRTGLAAVDEDQDVSVSNRLRRLAGVVPKKRRRAGATARRSTAEQPRVVRLRPSGQGP